MTYWRLQTITHSVKAYALGGKWVELEAGEQVMPFNDPVGTKRWAVCAAGVVLIPLECLAKEARHK